MTTISTFTDLVLTNTTNKSGTLVLPPTSQIAGRTFTIKDSTGACSNSTLFISTSGGEIFEDGTTIQSLRTAFGFMKISGSAGKWYITPTTQPNSLRVSTIRGNTVSVSSVFTSSVGVSTLALTTNTGFSSQNFQVSSVYLAYWGPYLLNTGFRVGQPQPFRFVSSGPPPFTPASISGLVMWLDATTITGVSNGGAVTQWIDAASGMNFSNVGAVTYLASGINSKPVVNIAGPGPYMQFAGTVPTIGAAGATIYAVVKETAGGLVQPNYSGVTFQVLWQMNNYANGWEGYPYNFQNTTVLGTLTNTSGRFTWYYPMATSAFQTAHILKVISASGSWQQFFMSSSLGTYSTSASGTSPGLASPIRLGACADGPGLAYYCGYFAEVILYNTVLSAAQQTSIETYLKAKWGV